MTIGTAAGLSQDDLLALQIIGMYIIGGQTLLAVASIDDDESRDSPEILAEACAPLSLVHALPDDLITQPFDPGAFRLFVVDSSIEVVKATQKALNQHLSD
jgi:hypothetical protein